ncbi:MAG: gamma-glutamyl kinase [Pseudomonadota bacterium]
MLMFHKAKLVFLAVPKTGTTAYAEALEPLATMVVRDPPELKHAPVYRYNRFFRPMFEKFVGDDLTVLAVMREPIDWLGSWYRYRKRPFLDGQRTSTKDISFDAFVDAYCKGDTPPFANVGNQARFLRPHQNGTHVTHVFRYDDQDGLRGFLEARLETTIKTAQVNASPPENLDLSEDTEAKLRRKFALDFEVYDSICAGGTYTPPPAPEMQG